MNTDVTKRIVFLVIGALIGACSGALIYKAFERQDETFPDAEEIDGYYTVKGKPVSKEEYEAYVDAWKEGREWQKAEETSKIDLGEQPIPSTEKDLVKRTIESMRNIDYSTIAKKNGTVEDAAKELLGSDLEKAKVVDPFVISMEDFTNSKPEYNKVALTYFALDKTLVDPQEDPIDNVNNLIGDTNLEKFGMMSDDPDVVYVRNMNVTTDFEVVRTKKSYSESVLGIKGKEVKPIIGKSKAKETERPNKSPVRANRSRKVNKIDDNDDNEEG